MIAVLVWAVAWHPYCGDHLACDERLDGSQIRLLWWASASAGVAVAAIALGAVSHVKAAGALAKDEAVRVNDPRNLRADRLLIVGGALTIAAFTVAFATGGTSSGGALGERIAVLLAWLSVVAAVGGSGSAFASWFVKPSSGVLQRWLVLPILVVGAFALLFSWSIIVVGTLE